jgi:hypothetical protein
MPCRNQKTPVPGKPTSFTIRHEDADNLRFQTSLEGGAAGCALAKLSLSWGALVVWSLRQDTFLSDLETPLLQVPCLTGLYSTLFMLGCFSSPAGTFTLLTQHTKHPALTGQARTPAKLYTWGVAPGALGGQVLKGAIAGTLRTGRNHNGQAKEERRRHLSGGRTPVQSNTRRM